MENKLRNYFNAISSNYKVNEYASFFITKFLRKISIGKINCNHKNVLEIMSGNGENVRLISKKYSVKSITTVDFSDQMNKISKIKNPKTNLKQYECDFFDFEITNRFDVILCSFGIKTIDINDFDKFVDKLSGLLNKNGELLILEIVSPKNKNFDKILHFYLYFVVPFIFGKSFRYITKFQQKLKNLNQLKMKLEYAEFVIIEHKRYFDAFELIKAKKI